MKVDVKYTYNKEEIVEIVLAEHSKNQPAPKDHEWKATLNYRDELEIEAVAITKGKEKEEAA